MIDFQGLDSCITSRGSTRLEDISSGLVRFCKERGIEEVWVKDLEDALEEENESDLHEAYQRAADAVMTLLSPDWCYGSSDGLECAEDASMGFWKVEEEE
jgi:hypothetical protein